MKTKIAAALCLLLSCPIAAVAEEIPFYIGSKVGQLNIDVSETILEADNASAVSLIGGYNLGNGFAMELELIPTTEADISIKGGAVVGTIEVQTVAVYLAYRLPFANNTVYFKAKGGVLNEQVEAKVNGLSGSYKESDSGLSVGLGAGYNLNKNISLEAEYTIIEQDVDFLGAGINIRF